MPVLVLLLLLFKCIYAQNTALQAVCTGLGIADGDCQCGRSIIRCDGDGRVTSFATYHDSMAFTRFSGSLVTEIGLLTELGTLHVAGNGNDVPCNIRGTLPSQIALLSQF